MDLNRLHNDIHEGALQLIAEHRAQLFAKARELCGNDDEADELVIRTIDQAVRKIGTYAGEGSVLSWMTAILTNLHNHDHRNRVVRGTKAVEAEDLEKCAGADWTTDEEILRHSDSEAIRAAIAELDPKYNQVLMMRYYEEFSLKQIAAVLRLPLGTVCRRAQIAHRLLAGKLGAELGKARKPLAILAAVLAFLSASAATAVATVPALAPVRDAVVSCFTASSESSMSRKPAQESPVMKCTNIVAAAALAAVCQTSAGEDGPDRYLQYVVCSGAQYVNTGFAPDQDTKTEVVFTPSVLTGTRCLFCSRTASAYYDFFITTTAPGARIDYGLVQQTASPRFTPADTEHPVACVMDGPRTSIDGWCYYSADPSTSFTLARPIYLLCAYSFDSVNTLSSYCSGRLHSCRIWDGDGNVQRDLLPAERDGVVGLWDAQNRVFYPGQSKDDSVLTAGPERTSGICEILEAKAVAVGSGLDISGRLARIGEEGATVALEWGTTEELGESETIAAFASDDVARTFSGSLRNVAGQAVYWRLVATDVSGRFETPVSRTRTLPSGRLLGTGGEIRCLEDGDVIHVFREAGTFVAPSAEIELRYLVVGGGGAGGGNYASGGSAAGGGAGALLTGTVSLPASISCAVTVGAGGLGQAGKVGGAGAASSLALGQTTVEAPGGGGGAIYGNFNGGNGGCGGGAVSTGKAGVGSVGGNGGAGSGNNKGGGGGGMGADGASDGTGAGGEGVMNDITGDGVWYCGGGGGCGAALAGPGGRGGGADGSMTVICKAGEPGTGGGGGGAYSAYTPGAVGGAGGSGIVIVRYTPPEDLLSANISLVDRSYAYADFDCQLLAAGAGLDRAELSFAYAEKGRELPEPTLVTSSWMVDSTYRHRVTGLTPGRDYVGRFVASSGGSSVSFPVSFSTFQAGAPVEGGVRSRRADGAWFHVFREAGELTLPDVPTRLEYLVVAGGGGGGASQTWGASAAGGGAGGMLTGTNEVAAGTSLAISVGKGAVPVTGEVRGLSGENSVLAYDLTELIAVGGGGGGTWKNGQYAGLPGGSGGGALGKGNAPGAGTDGQGFAGGASAGNRYCGGGGGAGGPGEDGTAAKPGDGGIGRVSAITGESVYYAGGGGASTDMSSVPAGAGGLGGGGAGGIARGEDGKDGLGGGGGGCGSYSFEPTGGKGGDGVVIVAYVPTNGLPAHPLVELGSATVRADQSSVALDYDLFWAGEGQTDAALYVLYGTSPDALTERVPVSEHALGRGSFVLTGLMAGEKVFLRLSAENASGTGTSAVAELETNNGLSFEDLASSAGRRATASGRLASGRLGETTVVVKWGEAPGLLSNEIAAGTFATDEEAAFSVEIPGTTASGRIWWQAVATTTLGEAVLSETSETLQTFCGLPLGGRTLSPDEYTLPLAFIDSTEAASSKSGVDVVYDAGAPHRVSGLRLRTTNDGQASTFDKMVVWASNDRASWTLVCSNGVGRLAGGVWCDFPFAEQATGDRYYRFAQLGQFGLHAVNIQLLSCDTVLTMSPPEPWVSTAYGAADAAEGVLLTGKLDGVTLTSAEVSVVVADRDFENDEAAWRANGLTVGTCAVDAGVTFSLRAKGLAKGVWYARAFADGVASQRTYRFIVGSEAADPEVWIHSGMTASGKETVLRAYDGEVGAAPDLTTSPAAWFVMRADSAKAVQALRLWTYYGGQTSDGGYWVRYRSAVVEYTTDEIAWPATTTCTSGSRTFNVVDKDAVPAVEWKPVTTGYESFETATPFLPVIDLVFPKRLRNAKYIRVSGITNFSVKELQLRNLPKPGLMLIVK